MSVDPVHGCDDCEGTAPVGAEVRKSAAPTRKWIVTQITALAALATMWVTTGGWDTEETIAAIGLLSQAALGYLTTNEDTPGGVPVEVE